MLSTNLSSGLGICNPSVLFNYNYFYCSQIKYYTVAILYTLM